MAGLQLRAVTGSIALTASTAKTCLQLAAAANQRVKLTNLRISFDGVTSTAVPAQVRILRQTTAGTMSALTLVPVESEITETPQTTATFGASVEPTAGAVLANFTIPQYMGLYEKLENFGQEIWIGGGGRLGIEVNSPSGVNARVEVQIEE